MADYLGWDIGGVHLKLSRLSCSEGTAVFGTRIIPFEIWKNPAGLAGQLRAMLGPPAHGTGAPGRIAAPDHIAASGRIVAHGITMTAELSDAFASRNDGVRAILTACEDALAGAPLRVLDLDGAFVSCEEAKERPLRVAAANWMATARLAARLADEALLIDVGSTTTDIVPLAGGSPRPAGRTDTERLTSGELVYTGILRTPPASLVDVVPLAGGWCRVAPEHFAVTADVYRVLGAIDDTAYTVPTPNGRGTGRDESAARLARVVCSDLATLGMPAVEAIAAWIHHRQVERIADGVRQVMSRAGSKGVRVAIVAGAGAFLAEEAARSVGLETARLASLLRGVGGDGWDQAAPSAALALLLAEAEGEPALQRAWVEGAAARGASWRGRSPAGTSARDAE